MGEHGEAVEVQMTLISAIETRHVSGEHAAVRSLDISRYKGNLHTVDVFHAEHEQDVDVRVPAPDEDQILHDYFALVVVVVVVVVMMGGE